METGIIYQASPKKVQVERSYELPQQNATEYFDEEPDTEDNFSDDKTVIIYILFNIFDVTFILLLFNIEFIIGNSRG